MNVIYPSTDIFNLGFSAYICIQFNKQIIILQKATVFFFLNTSGRALAPSNCGIKSDAFRMASNALYTLASGLSLLGSIRLPPALPHPPLKLYGMLTSNLFALLDDSLTAGLSSALPPLSNHQITLQSHSDFTCALKPWQTHRLSDLLGSSWDSTQISIKEFLSWIPYFWL